MEDNVSKAIMIGFTTLMGVMTISAIIIFFNSSVNVVKNVSEISMFSKVYREDIDSTLLMSNTGNYIKGTSVINLLNYYEEDPRVSISISNIKYIDNSGNVQVLATPIDIMGEDAGLRQNSYNIAMRYLMDNQDFTISVEERDSEVGIQNIVLRGV